MKLLLAHGDPIERRRLSDFLAGTRYTVVPAGSASRARKLLESEELDIAVLESYLAGPAMHFLRASPRRVYVLAARERWTQEDIVAAYSAGAHDLVRLPVCREEFCARVSALQRMRRWLDATAAPRQRTA